MLKRDAFVLYYNNNKNIKDIASIFNKSTRTIYRWIKEIKSNNQQKQKVKRKNSKKYPSSILLS
ncbi:MAG: helix-turn-helix domain-containing protein [Candidatus Helarchaeota archaeon]